MERLPLGKGRFLIQMSPEEIADLNEATRICIEAGVNCVNVVEREKEKKELNPEELQKATKMGIEIAVRAAEILSNKQG